MKFVRKHKKASIIVLVILIFTFSFSVAFGKYFFNIINNYILESRNFYFNSSQLTINNKKYQINNWDGISSYPITVDLDNQKNLDVYTIGDITYDISYDCEDTVTCTLSKTSGTIREQSHTDSYILTVVPKQTFKEGESVRVKTIARSKTPYEKELSATYTLKVTQSNFSYSIDDEEGSLVALLHLNNSLTFYTVQTAFGSKQVGDKVSVEEYEALSDTNKANCYSAIVTLEFDPNVVLLDSTNPTILNRLPSNYQTTTINGNQYVSKYSFKMNAISSNLITFYKNDKTADYTYPIKNDTPIVNVSVQLPEE